MNFNRLFKLPTGSQEFLKRALYLGGVGISFPNDSNFRNEYTREFEEIMVWSITLMNDVSLEHLYKNSMIINRDIDLVKLYQKLTVFLNDLSEAPQLKELMLEKDLDKIYNYFIKSEKYFLSPSGVSGKLLKVIEHQESFKYAYSPKRKNNGVFNIHFFEKYLNYEEISGFDL